MKLLKYKVNITNRIPDAKATPKMVLLKQDFVKTAYRGKYYDYYSNSYIENAIYINVKNPYRLDANMEIRIIPTPMTAITNDKSRNIRRIMYVSFPVSPCR